MKAMGLLFAYQTDSCLREITNTRTMSSVPFLGRYRVIDFILSSLVNTGTTNVGIITMQNYNSLMDHLGSGKEWDLNRKRDGLYILPPFAQKDSLGIYKGKVDAIASNMPYIKRSSEEICVLCDTNVIINTTFDDAIQKHLDTGADITIIHKSNADKEEILSEDLLLSTDKNSFVTDIAIGDLSNAKNKLSLGIYIINKSLLLDLINEAISHNLHNFEKDILLLKHQKIKIYAYEYSGYAARLTSVPAYFKHTMNLLNPEVSKSLFSGGQVYTKVKDEVPTIYGPDAVVSNCLVADGCYIDGSIENCVLFRGVKIHKGAKLKNCIIMQYGQIMEYVDISYVISDKSVLIKEDRLLNGHESYPVVLAKGAVI